MSPKALIAALLLAATPVLAETDGPGPNLVIDVDGQAKGEIVVDLLSDVAPKHVAQIVALAKAGEYDDVVFHRVIDGFMAQTGDVQFGKNGGSAQAGMGGSNLPDLPAEFSSVPFDRGVVGMARSMDPNSANSQFFIMFAPAPHLDGQYTVVGRVISGMDVVDAIRKGDGPNGSVSTPDRMVKVTVQE
ncbi:peptidylprolyl isomerase [Gemmobacter caeni]|jgi:peptidylprolyl isomerase|uniref:Peptidyl-prolyl cis-trans isomerase n=1 Tax=Gemmobacter caeni TaxID=589035 RepID=A0A2T6AQD1_9RHOB|nr:peptidylprolyl isomerase [Gemmobacter caeni]PTX45956.1 peptidylprolyl isomerase [Gemmobacter caeni]TWI94258.1 peptidylprolyl isomerase [Gemmobacter caeni]